MIKISNYSGTFTLGGISLKVLTLNPQQTQKTRKQVIGKSLIINDVIGLEDQQWELSGSGVVLGTTTNNLSTNRAAIEALDDAATHALVDGIHDGTYYVVPGSVQFGDSGERGNISYTYTFKLIEE